MTIEHKKARESEIIAHPALLGSRIAFQPRISNAEAHAVVYLKTGILDYPFDMGATKHAHIGNIQTNGH